MRAGLTLNRVSKTITMIQLNIVVCSANDAVSSMTAWQKRNTWHTFPTMQCQNLPRLMCCVEVSELCSLPPGVCGSSALCWSQ